MTGENMKSPYTKDAWYCDICGGFFQYEDAGYIGKDGKADICEECHERQFDTAGNATLQ